MSLKHTLITAVLLGATAASAQTVATGSVANGASAEITLTGAIQSSLTLTIAPQTGTAFTSTLDSTTSTASANPATATVDFGSFSTLSPPANGARVTEGTGAFVWANLTATLSYNGASTGAIQVVRKDDTGSSPIAPANVRLLGTGTWTSSSDGTALTTAQTLASGAISGAAQDHSIGLFIPDTQGQGTFSTVVTYTATAN